MVHLNVRKFRVGLEHSQVTGELAEDGEAEAPAHFKGGPTCSTGGTAANTVTIDRVWRGGRGPEHIIGPFPVIWLGPRNMLVVVISLV